MSALSANANSVTILTESSDHVMVRLFLHQNTAGNLSSLLVVNTDALTFRTQYLTIDPAVFFPPGCLVVGSASGTEATVCYNVNANTIMVTTTDSSNDASLFTISDILVGNREGTGNTSFPNQLGLSANVTAVGDAPRVLAIDGVSWSVQGPNAAIGLEFGNSTVFETVMMLSGRGYYGKNELDAPIEPTDHAHDTNIYISTYNVPAGGGYSITLSLRKVEGFASPPSY